MLVVAVATLEPWRKRRIPPSLTGNIVIGSYEAIQVQIRHSGLLRRLAMTGNIVMKQSWCISGDYKNKKIINN